MRVMIAQEFVSQGSSVQEWRRGSYARLSRISIRNKDQASERAIHGISGPRQAPPEQKRPDGEFCIRPNVQLFWMTMVGNLWVMSLARSATPTATLRAISL